MKRMLLALIALLSLAGLTAYAEGTTIEARPADSFARLLMDVYGDRGLLSDEVWNEALAAGRLGEDADPDAFRAVDSFCLSVEGDADDAVFTSFSIAPRLMQGAKLFGVVCTLDDGLGWTVVPATLNVNGGVNVPFTYAQVRALRSAREAVLFLMCDADLASSPLYREIRFAPDVPTTYYEGLDGRWRLFGEGQKAIEYPAEAYLEAWDELVAGHGDYVQRTDLGLSSDGRRHCRLYTFRAVAAPADGPKIIIVSGQHGYEKTAPFGLYWFARDLIRHWEEDPLLKYIHDNVTLLMMPCMNPYGFDHYVRVNANGVDLNRNYDYRFDPDRDTSSGPAAFSEPETDMVRDVVEANPDALCVIDFHNYGNYRLDAKDLNAMNWHSYHAMVNRDPYYSLLAGASQALIDEMTVKMREMYGQPDAPTYGKITDGANRGGSMLRNWALSKDVMGMTFEALNGFPDDRAEAASYRAQKANAELIGNWIGTIVRTFERWQGGEE